MKRKEFELRNLSSTSNPHLGADSSSLNPFLIITKFFPCLLLYFTQAVSAHRDVVSNGVRGDVVAKKFFLCHKRGPAYRLLQRSFPPSSEDLSHENSDTSFLSPFLAAPFPLVSLRVTIRSMKNCLHSVPSGYPVSG